MIDGYLLRLGDVDEATAAYREKLVENMRGAIDAFLSASTAGQEFSDEQMRLIQTMMDLTGYYGYATTATEENTKATEAHTAALAEHTAAQEENAEAVATAQDAADKLKTQISATSAALKDFESYGNLSTDSMKGLTEAMGDSLDALFDETGALTDTGAAAFQTASEFEHAKDAAEYLQAAAQAANYANLIAQIQTAGTAAVISTQQIAAMLQAVGMSANIADAQIRGMKRTAAENGTVLSEELLRYVNTDGILETLREQADAIARNAPKSGSKSGSGGKSSASGKSGTEKDAELEALKQEVSLEKQRLSFLEASGAAGDERIAKMRDVQNALHAQAEHLRGVKAHYEEIGRSDEKIREVEDDILSLSTEWHSIQSKIKGVYEDQAKTELERLKGNVSLEEQWLSLLEAAGESDEKRIAKLRDIQAALQAQEDYLNEIHASDEDILAVATKRFKIEQDIKNIYDAQKKAWEEAQKAREEAEKAEKQAFYDRADAEKKALEKQRDAALAPLQAQLDALNAQREAVESQRKEQERLLAVEQARAALQNAQNQRNVRQYNADTQQWEWVADSRAVEDAKKAVIDAEKALADYHAEQLYQAQKKAIEDQIEATKEAFEMQRDAWTEAAELVRSGAMSVAEAMAYAQQAVQNAVSSMSDMGFGVGVFDGDSSGGWSASGGGGSSGGGSFGESSSGDRSSGKNANGSLPYSQKMPDMRRNTERAGQTVRERGFDVTYDENGYATKATKAKPYIYDSGGVLHGLGGIKATARDEAVLNPDHTEKFLEPRADERLERVANQTERLMDLGEDLIPPEVLDGAIAATMAGSMGALSIGGREILTGARPATAGFPLPQANVSSIGTQNNGDTYQIYVNGALLQNVSQGTTLEEMVQAAKLTLPLYWS